VTQEHRQYGVRKYLEAYGLRVSCQAVVFHDGMSAIHVRYQITDVPQSHRLIPVTDPLVSRQAWSILTAHDVPIFPEHPDLQEFAPLYRPVRVKDPGEISEGWITFDYGGTPAGVVFTYGGGSARWDEQLPKQRRLVDP
jgi:hypothetical protein